MQVEPVFALLGKAMSEAVSVPVIDTGNGPISESPLV